MFETRVLTSVLATLLAIGPVDVGLAQTRRPRVPDPAATSPTPPTSTEASPSPAEPEMGPYLERTELKEWTLTYRVSVFSDRPDKFKDVTDPATNKRGRTPDIVPFEFETLGFIFPRVPATASSESSDAAQEESSIGPDFFHGAMRVDGQVVDNLPQMLRGFPYGIELGRWDVGERGSSTLARQIQLEVTIPMQAWNVKFNEKSALNVSWPENWPASAQQALESQLYVDQGFDAKGKLVKYDFKKLDRLMEVWKRDWKITDFRSVKPVMLAKLITSKVWSEVQPSGNGILTRPRTGELMGIELQNPERTLTTGKGSEHDLVVLTVALMRKAGLPARTVIGYDAGDESDGWLDKGSKSSKLRSWVEFCIFDEARNTINWIPVDILKLRRLSNRPMPIDKEWRYFGTNDDANRILPFSLHFHPPTDVVSYGVPGFWGWFVTPKAPELAEQSITMSAAAKTRRGGESGKEPPKRGK